MAALTSARDTTEITGGARQLVLPVKARWTIHQGALVALDANGWAVPARQEAGLTAAGRAEETVENGGGDGGAAIRVLRGTFVFDNSATAANRVTAAHVLKPCYMEDDHTVTALAAGSSIAGLVVRVDSGGVAVQIEPALNYPVPTGAG